MEMELLYSRALEMNGGLNCNSDEDDDLEPQVLRQRYDHTIKELEFTKKRLTQQHEDDIEQLLAVKKQLEKKVIKI